MELYQMIESRPDIFKMYIKYDMAFNTEHKSKIKYPTLSITYMDGKTKMVPKPVVFQLNRWNNILEYTADQLGEYKFTLSNEEKRTVSMTVSIITYRNDLHRSEQRAKMF